MADKQKTIDIIFGAVDNTGTTFKSLSRSMSDLNRSAAGLTAPLAGVADSVLKLEASLIALGAAALTFATSQAVGVEAALIDLQKVMSEGEGSASDYSDTFSDLSSKFGVGSTSIIETTAAFRQAGFDMNESLVLVEQSLLAVNAADLTVAESGDLLIGTLRGFQAEAGEAAHLLDVLNAVSNNAGANVSQLGEGFKVLAPIAKTLGLSFEETAALLTPVVEVTRQGTESANSLKTAISNLIKPTKERRDLLENELGIQLEIDGVRRDTKDVLYELIDATQGLSDNEKQRVATVIAGAEQMSRFLAVLNGAARSEEILKVAMESSGSTLEEFAVRTQSAEFALKQLRAAFTAAAAAAGLEYIDQTKLATQATTKLLESFKEAIQGENADRLFSVLRGALEDFSARVFQIAENLPAAFEGIDFSELIRAFGDLGDEIGESFTAVFGDVDLTTVEGLRDALQTVVNAFTSLTDVSAGIVDGLEPLFDLIGEAGSSFSGLSAETKKSIGEFLGLAKTVDTLLPIVGALGTGLQSVGNGLLAIAGVKALPILTELSSISVANASKGGLLGAALFGASAGFGIGELINEYFEDENGTIGTKIYDWLNADEVDEALGQMEFKFNEAGAAAEDFADSQNQAAEATQKVAEFVELDIDALNKDIAAKLDAKQAQGEYAEAIEETADAQEKAAGTLETVKIKTEEAAKAAAKAAQETKEYQLKLLEIASDERIANIQANVELNIAELESQTKIAVALIESITASVESTGDLLGGLFGNLENASGRDRFQIEQQIRLENERRDKALQQQKELTAAQIEYLRQKTAAIAKGDSIINVNAEGLTPALELVFQQILEYTQVRANEQGLELLIGI